MPDKVKAQLVRLGDLKFHSILDIRLLRTPLDFFHADHMRQRHLCETLEFLAQAERVEDEVLQQLLQYLEWDMPLHTVDEEEDLFQLLRRRARARDDLEHVLSALSGEHRADAQLSGLLCQHIRDLLKQPPDALVPTDEMRAAFMEFVTNQKRHLMVENSVIMPLAEARLTAADRRDLGRRMAARRGVDLR